MTSTITGTHTSAITLGTGTYANPVYVTGTIDVASGVALQGASGTAWTVTNDGLIRSRGTARFGHDYGVALASGGEIINQASAVMIGFYGADITGAAGTVINAGTIGGGTSGYAGILLAAGGTIVNQSGGLLTGYMHGVEIRSATGTVINAGSIGNSVLFSPNESGVALDAGGMVTNQAGGTISGVNGVTISGGGGDVINAGMISGAVKGVRLSSGGSVTNPSGGTISGVTSGVYLDSAGSVTNAGKITSSNVAGVFLRAGGSVINQSGGTIITGGTAFATVQFTAAGTLDNAGAVTGGVAGAVSFASGFSGLLIVRPGAVFSGIADGGNTIGATAVSTLELASGASAGTLSGLGTQFVNFAQATIDAGAQWSLVGGTLVSGVTLSNAGSVSGVLSLLGTAHVTNAAGGTMSGSPAPLYGVTGSTPSITNAGLLSATGKQSAGVALFGGCSVTNKATGTIVGGGAGIFITSASTGANAGFVTNDGSIGGISDGAGGTIFNQSAGIITGTKSGISLYFANPTSQSALVLNSGFIGGGSGHSGIYLPSGGLVSNSGTITGGSGGINFGTAVISGSVGNTGYIASSGTYAAISFVVGNGTITNDGTIGSTTATGDAIDFASGANNRLIDDPGAVFNGRVNGGGLAASSLELATGLGAGTISGLDGSKFANFTQVQIDANASWAVQGSIPGGETVVFAGSGALLQLANPDSVATSVVNFAAGETIDLTGVDPSTVNFSAGVLSFSGGSFSLSLSGASGVTAMASADGAAVVVCFRAGTRIATMRGEVAVEELRVGERVRVVPHSSPCPLLSPASAGERRGKDIGGAQPIKWIGHRHVDCARHPAPRKVWPVRVATGAFAAGLPRCDLWLSPDHAIFVDGVLIPVRYLINGGSIVQVPVDAVTYYHVELPCHDVLLAEGLPVESYLDAGNRRNFANGEGAIALHPDFAPAVWEAAGCAPPMVTGPIVDGVRRRLARRRAA